MPPRIVEVRPHILRKNDELTADLVVSSPGGGKTAFLERSLRMRSRWHADLAIITKTDLAEFVDFNRAEVLASSQAVRPGLPVFESAARAEDGLTDWLRFSEARLNVGVTPA